MTTRRQMIGLAVAALGVAALAPEDALGGPRRRVNRRTRRRVRRRHRRRVRRRVILGVPTLVVPVSLAVGWELEVDATVYVVTRIYMDDGVEKVVLTASNGATLEEPILREDTAENGKELEGSELPEGDSTTPGIEIEIEIEIEE